MVLAALINGSLLLWGAALASVPIIIHLLSKRKVRRVKWAAMHWLEAAMKRHQRRLKLENWLILALRVAAIALLGLALARPVLTDSSLAGALGNKRSVYLIVDNSLSTEAKVDARSVFERVKHESDLILKNLNKDDSIAVIVTNHPYEEASDGLDPFVLIPRSVGGKSVERAREALASLRSRQAPARWSDALRRVQAQTTLADVNRQIFVVTDLQAGDWLRAPREVSDGPSDPGTTRDGSSSAGEGSASSTGDATRVSQRLEDLIRLPSSIRVINVGGKDRRNMTVAGVSLREAQDPFIGRPLHLAVEVANHGAKPVRGATLEVYVDDQGTRRLVNIPDLPAADAGLRIPKPARETVHVSLPRDTFEDDGTHTVRVVVSPPREDAAADSLGADSTRYASFQVRRRIRVLAWTRDSSSNASFRAERYLEGIYAGSDPSEGGIPLTGGLYGFEHVEQESMLQQALRERDASPIDLIVLANVAVSDSRTARALADFVRSGGGLLVFTGNRLEDPAQLNTVFHDVDDDQRLLPYPVAEAELKDRGGSETAWTFDLSEREAPHPVAAPFTNFDPVSNIDPADWIKKMPPEIWGRTPFVVPEQPKGSDAPSPEDLPNNNEADVLAARNKVVLRFNDGKPAIVSTHVGEGRAIWVGTSLDNGWLAQTALFLAPFLEESALYLTKPADRGRNVTVGQRLRINVPADARQVRLSLPKGGQAPLTRIGKEDENAARAEFDPDVVGTAGRWDLTYERTMPSGEMRKIRDSFSVNVDASEGALLPASSSAITSGLPDETDIAFSTSYGSEEKAEDNAREGEITRILLWILLGLLVLESILAMRFGRRSTAPAGDAPST